MKSVNAVKLLLILCSVFLVFTVSVYIFYNSSRKGNVTYITLLPQKNAKTVTEILIDSPSFSFPIHLLRENGKWFLDLGARYPADDNRIERLFEEFSGRKKASVIIGTDLLNYGLSGPDTVHVQFFNAQHAIISSAAFGDTDITGESIFLISGNEKKIFRTDDTYSHFLNPRASYWVNLTPFSTLQDKGNIQRLIVNKENEKKEFRAGRDPQPEELGTVLQKLQCLDITNVPMMPQEEIILEMGNTEVITIHFAELDGENTIMTTSLIPGSAYIISRWAKEKIDSVFEEL
ncbi:DUF4340 domain-containing protein [Brucepastera parasyntrophica]|uniref:DUF4340 domain-containing protein n=1 Tax=Brucepastera parasyntrophica TaxID=2880008 RepID=UPI00210C3AFA|nr:DUF4340 domain-containing protein [Brucepastera parasyntrophica]ULQ60011.1 DUF4340 domain-containing protein [Brucepastera parasyntrophica]